MLNDNELIKKSIEAKKEILDILREEKNELLSIEEWDEEVVEKLESEMKKVKISIDLDKLLI